MKIKEFKKHFVDYVDESEQLGVPAKIEIDIGYVLHPNWYVVIGYKVVGSKMILTTKESSYPKNFYEFTDSSIFDNITDVVFEIKDTEVSDFEYEDTCWSDRIFVFSYEL